MEDSYRTDEILKKYTSSSNENYFMSMAHQSLPDRLASLKAHVFSGNANSQPTTGPEQTNCFIGTKIYSSNSSVTPPSEFNISLASRGKLSGVCNADALTSISTSRQEKPSVEDKIVRASTFKTKLCQQSNSLDFKNSQHGSVIDQSKSTGISNAAHYNNDAGATVNNSVRQKLPLERKLTPIVIVTPASEQSNDLDSNDMNSKIGTSNGESDEVSLNDCIDSCSLSSICSEDLRSDLDDILTDDDPSESDSAPQVDENVEKVSKN
jgi:hypothetical protein